MVPGENGPWEKWSLGKMVPGKLVPGKNGPREKWSPKKMVPGKNGPRKNVLQELFSVKRMLGNLNDFIFIVWFHYTHTKIIVGHLTILHALNCRTPKGSRKVCCLVLGFHRLITSEHSTHTLQCLTLTPRFFVSFLSPRIGAFGNFWNYFANFENLQIWQAWIFLYFSTNWHIERRLRPLCKFPKFATIPKFFFRQIFLLWLRWNLCINNGLD